MDTINDRIKALEAQVAELQGLIENKVTDDEEKGIQTTSVVGGGISRGLIRPIDGTTGRGWQLGGAVVWNNTEIDATLGTEPAQATKAYNKHSHSRYSGGALIKDGLEIVAYDWGSIVNKDSQQFYSETPKITKTLNTKGEAVENIGPLDVVFNEDTQKWSTSAHEIDVKKCNFVIRDENGNIALDANGTPMSAPIYNDDPKKSCIIWDADAKVWRFLAVYGS
jgi:hypothetical protein